LVGRSTREGASKGGKKIKVQGLEGKKNID